MDEDRAVAEASRTFLLGRVVVAGTGLEFMASQTAWMLLGRGPQFGDAITRRMPLSQVLRLVGDLAGLQLSGDLKSQAEAAVRRAQQAASLRNEFIHSVWVTEHNGDGSFNHGRLRVNRDRSNDAGFRLEDATLNDIDEAVDEINGASDQLGEILYEAGLALGRII